MNSARAWLPCRRRCVNSLPCSFSHGAGFSACGFIFHLLLRVAFSERSKAKLATRNWWLKPASGPGFASRFTTRFASFFRLPWWRWRGMCRRGRFTLSASRLVGWVLPPCHSCRARIFFFSRWPESESPGPRFSRCPMPCWRTASQRPKLVFTWVSSTSSSCSLKSLSRSDWARRCVSFRRWTRPWSSWVAAFASCWLRV